VLSTSPNVWNGTASSVFLASRASSSRASAAGRTACHARGTRHGAVEHVLDGADEAGDGRVRALRPALRAARALLGDEVRHLEADAGHVADRAGCRGNRAERGERIGDAVLAGHGEAADLLPEAAGVADALRAAATSSVCGIGCRRPGGSSAVGSPVGTSMSSSKPRRMTRRLSSTTRSPSLPNFCSAARGCPRTGAPRRVLLRAHQRRHGEERAHERGALHAVAQLGVGRLRAAMPKPSSA
jgi:hypothetical protein